MTETKSIPLQNGPFKIEDMPMVVRPEDAPLIFVDGFQGLAVFGDVVRINAYQLVQNFETPEGPPGRAFVARLAMSPVTMLQLMKWLGENVKFEAVPEGEVPDLGKKS
jgi:hypothetical protein